VINGYLDDLDALLVEDIFVLSGFSETAFHIRATLCADMIPLVELLRHLDKV